MAQLLKHQPKAKTHTHQSSASEKKKLENPCKKMHTVWWEKKNNLTCTIFQNHKIAVATITKI